jgi:carboxyl-terminal processing protease
MWAAITVVLLTALAVFAFSPRILAATPEDETRRYMNDISAVFGYVRDNYVDADRSTPKILVEGALKGLFESLGDPYSVYIPASDTTQLDDTTQGRYSGVGLEIGKVDKGAEVIAPFEGTPAYKAGINAGDIISKVDGESMAELTIEDIMKKIRGPLGSEVTLTVLRGESVTFEVKVKRDLIEVPAVKYTMIGNDIGYLRIIQFTSLAAVRSKEALDFFKSKGFKSLIIDVRSNPGGLLTSPIDIANYFIGGNQLIVGIHSDRSDAESTAYYANPKNVMVDPKLPIVMLVDKGSASASEILAGALKDTGRAVLFGVTTYGKGSVQDVRPLPDTGGEFKLTVARYYTPSGEYIDKKGIVPDTVIEEPKLTPEEEKSLTDLLAGQYVQSFVKSNAQPTDAQVGVFITDMRKKGIILNDRYLRRFVRAEVDRTKNSPPIYDLDFDIVLQAAVNALRAGQVKVK